MNEGQAERFGKELDKFVKGYVEQFNLEPGEVQVTLEVDVQTSRTYSTNGGS